MPDKRVIGAEHIMEARQRGRIAFETLPGDIVTAMAHETAARIGVRLLEGPIARPAPPQSDGAAAMRRALYRRGPKWIGPRRAARPRARRFGKIALIGAGGVGGALAHLAMLHDIAHEIALVDIAPGVAAALALDLNHACGAIGASARFSGGEDSALIAGADVVIVSAGRARGPGMSRADLLNVNRRVIQASAEAIKAEAPEAVAIVITNPLDEMTAEMLSATGFARGRVLGMAGTLDSARFRASLAKAAGVSPNDVEAMALGSHGAEMAPIASRARIKGRPLDVFLSPAQIAACVEDAVTGGGQVVALRKTGSAAIAPAHGAFALLEHMRGAQGGPVPVSVMLEGEFGVSGVPLGVPAHLGMGGLVRIEEPRLSEDELAMLRQAADAIRARLA